MPIGAFFREKKPTGAVDTRFLQYSKICDNWRNSISDRGHYELYNWIQMLQEFGMKMKEQGHDRQRIEIDVSPPNPSKRDRIESFRDIPITISIINCD